jgi:hypothetical protein
MRKVLYLFTLCIFIFNASFGQGKPPYFSVTYKGSNEKLDGRLLIMLSKNDKTEPRFQIVDGPESQLVFGLDAEEWEAGKPIVVDGSNAFGYPIESLSDVPAGDYFVQVLLHKYETFKKADGHIVKLPMDRGEGQQWNLAPGNLYSTPQKISFNPGSARIISLSLDKIIPPIKEWNWQL